MTFYDFSVQAARYYARVLIGRGVVRFGRGANMRGVLKTNAKSLGYTQSDVLRKELVGMMLHQPAPGVQIKRGNNVC